MADTDYDTAPKTPGVRAKKLAQLLPFALLVLLALGGALTAHRFASTLEQSQAEAQTRRLNDFANADRDAVQGSLRALEESLGGLSAYVGSAQVIDTTSFDAMANDILRRNPAVRAVGFAQRTVRTNAQAGAPLQRAQMALSSELISQRNSLGERVPVAPRDQYLPIARIVAIESDRFAYEELLGLDLLSDVDLANTLASANQSVSYQSLLPGRALIAFAKRATSDGKSNVIESTLFAEVEIASLLRNLDSSSANGNTSSQPEAQSRRTGDTADESRRTGDTADESRRTGDTADKSRRTGDTADESRRTGDTADESRNRFSQVRVFDSTDRSGLRLLFPAATANLAPPDASTAAIARLERSPVVTNSFAVLGRTFRVETTPLAAFFGVSGTASPTLSTPTLVRFGGIGLSLLGVLLAFNLITRNARIAKLVDIRGQELTVAYEQVRDSELMSMQSEKMSSLGQMVAGVAHEINTPLAYVTSNIELLQDRLEKFSQVASAQQELLVQLHQWASKTNVERNQWYSDALQQEQAVGRLRERTLGKSGALIDETMEGLVRVRDLVSTLKDFSRVDRVAVDDVDIHQCIESTLKIAHNVVKHSANIVRDYGVLPHVRCNPSQINQVLLNLISNAAQAMENTQDAQLGEIIIITRCSAKDIEILIVDNGTGMSADTRRKIFQPFFTTKASGQGTGLGLAICQKIIKAHNGNISVESSVGMGTIFTITLPIVGESVFS